MCEWRRQIQLIVDEIDRGIQAHEEEALTLQALARRLGYSEVYTARKFREISGLRFRDYLRRRRLAFALKEVRDGGRGLLDIAVDYGFSSHEAFTRAFRGLYGVTPSEYRREPRPVILRTKLTPFDRYCLGMEESGAAEDPGKVETYRITIPSHKFLHIKNFESNGYWDFWRRQNQIPGQDYETVCGLLDSIKGKLDDRGGSGIDWGSGQIMAYLNDPAGRLCDWGIPRVECWGARLPADWTGEVPGQLKLVDISAGEYVVFEHGPFDYERENRSVEERVERAMAAFDYAGAGCCLDTTSGRIMYFFYQPGRCFKYVRPVRDLSGEMRISGSEAHK